ncbi:MAG: ATP-binding cassette domain-containing protein, partial [Firmicutes bacterium]|nr:ATP-binding cassette domain-containing protein [Bacillota bacterium]
MNNEALISLRGVSVEYDGVVVLDHLDLDIKDKEFVTLLGPSGCGKTTTLRIIGGFTEPSTGDVFFDGKRINDVPPYKRNINTVFQRYALFPHLNVYENIEFGLKISNVPEEERKKRIKEMLAMVGLSGFELR